MNLKGLIDRKLLLMVVSPLARALLSMIVGYLSARGLPSEMIEQFAAALGVFGVVCFNLSWEWIDRKRAELAGERRVLVALNESGRT